MNDVRYANGSLLDSLLGPADSRDRLAEHVLVPRQPSRAMRIALLTKNLNLSGGNRVIMRLFDQLAESHQAEVHVFVVPEARVHIGALRHLVACKRRFAAAASVRLATRPIHPGDFDVLVSTSRRTLDFVDDLTHPAHVHLLQAIEAWDTVN